MIESKPGISIRRRLETLAEILMTEFPKFLTSYEHFGVLSPNYFFQMWTTVPYYSTDFLLRTRVEGVDVV